MVTETSALVQSVSPTMANASATTNGTVDNSAPQRRTNDNRRVYNYFCIYISIYKRIIRVSSLYPHLQLLYPSEPHKLGYPIIKIPPLYRINDDD